jgi:transcription elongation factor Elf1
MEAMDSTEEAPTTGWRSYRCPVCSHTDGVLLAGADAVLIRCSHCDTPLEVSVRGGGQNAAAKVAQLRRPERERA